MLKTPKDYKFESLDSINGLLDNREYIIGINDIVKFRFQTNNGIKILDIAAGLSEGVGNVGNQLNSVSNIPYVINADSMVKLPYIKEVNLVGKTIRESEEYLQEAYKSYYVDPFIQISVTNKRVLVFPGNGGDALVVNLLNNNTTLIEAIALAGGIRDRGRASKIKLIRDVNGKRKVYLIDLSTIEGLEYVNLIVQNGDYIYIEPTPQLGREVLIQVAPILSLVTSSIAVILAISRL
ncbi:MAG: polysaccharide biosynthesis/export family protein [Crocinitomicaceae bacterium]